MKELQSPDGHPTKVEERVPDTGVAVEQRGHQRERLEWMVRERCLPERQSRTPGLHGALHELEVTQVRKTVQQYCQIARMEVRRPGPSDFLPASTSRKRKRLNVVPPFREKGSGIPPTEGYRCVTTYIRGKDVQMAGEVPPARRKPLVAYK